MGARIATETQVLIGPDTSSIGKNTTLGVPRSARRGGKRRAMPCSAHAL
ncbi:MAG: hypothetical protein QM756_11360 [Polyangiaceae bacterium]